MLMTGIDTLPEQEKTEVLAKVCTFTAFIEDNDPHQEHDFGSFEHKGVKNAFKIDLYEDPEVKGADGRPVTNRVLTIMLAEEW
jgi:Protein of unknown function (DUF3768)